MIRQKILPIGFLTLMSVLFGSLNAGGASLAISFQYPVPAAYHVIYPFDILNSERGGYHAAQDLEAPAGTPIYAVANGIISYSKTMELYGYLITIDHQLIDGTWVYSLYGHLSTRRFHKISGEVYRGELIGFTADDDEDGCPETDGTCWRPHLHFSMRSLRMRDYPRDDSEMGFARAYPPNHPTQYGWFKPLDFINERSKIPIVGKWAIGRASTFGTYDTNTCFFSFDSGTPIQFGIRGDIPIFGDWDGDGISEIGVFRPKDSDSGLSIFFLRMPSGSTSPISFGTSNDWPIVGDWDGDRKADIGVSRPGNFYLNYINTGQTVPVAFGQSGDIPIIGDWDKNGKDEIGVFRIEDLKNQFYFDIGLTGDGAEYNLNSFGLDGYGNVGDLPIIGDWDGDGDTTIGVYRPSTGEFFPNNDVPNITPSQNLSVSLNADPLSGPPPLNTSLTANVSGTATGSINYSFWWNCNDPGTNVSLVSSICGDPHNSDYGTKIDGVLDNSETLGHTYVSTGTYIVKVIVERGSSLPAESRATIYVTLNTSETISPPSILTGVTSGIAGVNYTYSTGGSSSNLGHPVQYFFDWGDGTNSGWLPVGQTSVSKTWTSGGFYYIYSQARCAADPSVVAPEKPLYVFINPPGVPTAIFFESVNIRAKRGDLLTFSYEINNVTTNPVQNVTLGAWIRKSDPQGMWIEDSPNNLVVAVPMGARNYYARYFRIPCDVTSGQYDVRWLLLNEAGQFVDVKEDIGYLNIIPDMEKKRADLNGDDLVNSGDFGIMLSNWGSTTKPPADLNQDGYVNSQDVGIMMSNWYSPWPFPSNICGLGGSYNTAEKMEVGEPRFSSENQARLALSPSTGTYLIGKTFEVDVFVDTAEQNIRAVAAYIKYDPAHFRVNSVDTTDSVFGIDSEKIIDSTNGGIKISKGESTHGVNIANGKVARINLTAISHINPEADNFLLDFIPGSAFASSVIKDDALGTNVLSAVSSARFAVRVPSLEATTNPATQITFNSAQLNGTVNANNASTTVTFQYGLTTSYESTVTADQSPLTGSSDTAVSKTITGLTPNTTYHYRVVGVNSAGTTNGSDLNFTTSAIVPTVTTDAASGVTTSGATLNGTVNANNASATVTFQYGLTMAYGSTVTADQSPITGTSDTAVSRTITGLSANTTYHYRVVGVNSAGTTNGSDLNFTTLADTTPPSLTITSHSNCQHVTTANIYLSGTASDAGLGENGIQQVTVNGNRADNDTASGSGAATWSRVLSLEAGANQITVMAYDASLTTNSTTQTITIYYEPAGKVFLPLILK